MPDWSNPKEIARDGEAFIRLIFCLFGIYCWELFTTIGFEWSLITGQRKFKWPMVFIFFLCRYCILWALIGLIISFSLTSRANCVALYTFNSFCGNMAILTASTSLMLRTIALWERSLKIVIPIGILCLGHWALLWRGMFIVHAVWDPLAGSCVVDHTNHVFLDINFFYTMGFDLVVLVLTILALWRQESRSGLWVMLFRDGLVYFLVASACNCLPAILNAMNLSTTMDVIATVPAATISSIAACRAVIRLQEFNNTRKDSYIHTSSVLANEVRITRYRSALRKPQRHTMTRPEIHVTTDHIIMEDMSPTTAVETPRSGAPYNGNGNLKKSDSSLDMGFNSVELKFAHVDEESQISHAI